MRAPRCLFFLFLFVLTASLAADSVQPSLVFQSLDQSLWGPANTAPPARQRFELVNEGWNESGSGGGFWSVDTYLFGEAEFGAGGSGATNGQIGLWLNLNIEDPGSVDVTYPVTPTVIFPDANSFRAGDTVAIKTSYATDNGWRMETAAPKYEYGFDAHLALGANASARLCVFDCTDFDVFPRVDLDTGEFNVFTIGPGDTLKKPGWLLIPIGGRLESPDIATSATLMPNGRSLHGEGSDQFAEVTLNLTGIAAMLAGIKVPLKFNSANFPGFDDFSGIHLDYITVDVEAYTRLAARQQFHFDPELKIAMQFGKPLEHWVVSGGVIGPTSTSASVEVKAGDTVYVKYPATDKQPTGIDPTFRLDNQFESLTAIDISEGVTTKAARLGARIPSIEIFPELCIPMPPGIPDICTPSVDTPAAEFGFGPLLNRDDGIAAQVKQVFNASWQLEGFAPVTVDAFSLDPENPIIDVSIQTGGTRNLGAGRRQVSYAIDFGNGGDVKLSSVHLVADLAASFGAAWRFTVDQIIGCSVAANPDFNGMSNKELLAPGATLEAGEKRRVILIVSIYPKPDPPLYTTTSVADGTSPLDTLVTKSASSTVLLGPSVIRTPDDFVLFGDQFVKLDSIANSTGHVGSNDFVEVKNGNSAIVAGDLRAGRTLKVQGEITADYAFSGGVIDIVQKARLTLSGNMKPYTRQPAYALTAPVPGTPLRGNVWVPDNVAQTLQPGYYGDVTINAGATLTLAPGAYTFINLSVLNNGSLRVAGSSRGAVVNVLSPGEVKIGQNATVRAVLNAPRANVTFEERARLEGSASGRSITLRPGASASYHRDCDRLVDPDCDGSPNCGQ
jgi:hypothetical protein